MLARDIIFISVIGLCLGFFFYNILCIFDNNIYDSRLFIFLNSFYLLFIAIYFSLLCINIFKYSVKFYCRLFELYKSFFCIDFMLQFSLTEINICLLLLVAVIGFFANLHVSSYLSLDLNFTFFIKVLNCFIISMEFFVLSDSFLSMIIG